MGYRTDWKLIFNTAGKADEVMQWFKDFAAQYSSTQCGQLMQEMLDYAVLHQDSDVIEFAETSWKLYSWDDVICAIREKWDDDEEVDFAYATIGEECDDVDYCSGEWTYAYIERYIGDFDLSPVPKIQQNMEAEAKPKPPLKCTCGGFGAHSDWCDLTTGEYSEGAY